MASPRQRAGIFLIEQESNHAVVPVARLARKLNEISMSRKYKYILGMVVSAFLKILIAQIPENTFILTVICLKAIIVDGLPYR